MEYADKVLKSNVIFDACSDEPFAGGVAIKGNKILAVCKGDDIDQYISPDTEVFEYEDKMIMPGLVDAHDHLWWGAVADSSHVVNLTESHSEEEAIEMNKKYNLIMHMGLTDIKFEATVQDWSAFNPDPNINPSDPNYTYDPNNPADPANSVNINVYVPKNVD